MTYDNFRAFLLIRGIAFLLFGFLAISWPGMTFVTLVFIFALLILLSGVSNLLSGLTDKSRADGYRWLIVAAGIFEVIVGIYAFSNPGISLAALILLIASTFIIRGILEIAIAFGEGYSSSHRVLLIAGGLIGIIAGIVVFRYPVTAGLAFIWVMGIYALLAGSIYIIMSIMPKGSADDTISKT